MADSVNQFGASYKFGFAAADAPAITGVSVRAAELRWETEVNATATDGEGHVDSRTTTKKDKRQITGSFTGYISTDFDPDDIPESFNFQGRFYVVTNISDPRRKGEYNEVTIEAISNAGVTS